MESQRRRIIEEESWRRNPGRGILEEESWKRNPGRKILEEEAWGRNPGGGILEEESWKESWGRPLGGFLGGIREASGSLGWPWELKGHLGAEMCQNHCVLQHLSSRPPISSRRDESKCQKVL